MSDDRHAPREAPTPEETALRDALVRRRPLAIPPELAARLDRVPDEVRPLPSRPVRIALAALPLAAAAVILLGVAYVPVLLGGLTGASSGPATAPGGGWSAATTGGQAEIGPFGLPWVPLVAYFGTVLAIDAAIKRRRVGHWPRLHRPRWQGFRRATADGSARGVNWSRYAAYYLIPWTVWGLVIPRGDMLAAPASTAPGPGAEVSAAGIWWPPPSDWDQQPCSADGCPAPRYVYRVQPGQDLAWVITVRNRTLLPLRLLGRGPLDPEVNARLALLRDPSTLTADPSNLRAWEPVTLLPGQEVPVALIGTAWSCANPAAAPSTDARRTSLGSGPFIVDLFGWRTSEWANPPIEVTIAGCDTPQ